MVEFSNLGLLENQSIIKVNVSAIQCVTDNLPNSGALTNIAQVVNQSIIIANQSTILDNVDNDATIANQSVILQHNQTIDTVVDSIKTVTELLPDSGTLTSLATKANQTTILREMSHRGYVFPENTSLTVTLYTGAINTYGPYNVIKDSLNNTFSVKFNNTGGYVSSILFEDASALDKTYMFEISYGATHTPLIEWRVHSATNQVGPMGQTKFRVTETPAGEVLYYRGMSENASAHAEVSFRYHFLS